MSGAGSVSRAGLVCRDDLQARYCLRRARCGMVVVNFE